MFELPKTQDIAFAVNKTKEIAVSTVELNNKIFNEVVKCFNEITNNSFYTYSTKVVEFTNQNSDYAKEFIQTGTVKSLFGNSVKN